jgi:hypothetical protein
MPKRPTPQERRFISLTAIAVTLIVWSLFQFTGSTFAALVRNPKAMGNDLFNAQDFSRSRRERFNTMPSSPQDDEVPSPEVPLPETLPDPSASTDSSSSSSSLPPLTLEDLTTTERQTLRLQLRSGGCPTEGDARYIALCQEMLAAQPPKETREGLKNPNQ